MNSALTGAQANNQPQMIDHLPSTALNQHRTTLPLADRHLVFHSRRGRLQENHLRSFDRSGSQWRLTANRLPFPLNIRFLVKGWNLLFFRPHDFKPDPGQSAEWNHGADLVNGLGHVFQLGFNLIDGIASRSLI